MSIYRHEAVEPNQEFYPFNNVPEPEPFEVEDVSDFSKEIVVARVPFLGLNMDFRVSALTDSLNDLGRGESPLGFPKVLVEARKGFSIVQEFPLTLEQYLRSRSPKKVLSAQRYVTEVVLGSRTYYFDTRNDVDLIKRGLNHNPNMPFVLWARLVNDSGKPDEELIPYLGVLGRVKCRFIEKDLKAGQS